MPASPSFSVSSPKDSDSRGTYSPGSSVYFPCSPRVTPPSSPQSPPPYNFTFPFPYHPRQLPESLCSTLTTLWHSSEPHSTTIYHMFVPSSLKDSPPALQDHVSGSSLRCPIFSQSALRDSSQSAGYSPNIFRYVGESAHYPQEIVIHRPHHIPL